MAEDKSHRGAASQFFVAGELCRRGLVAVLTLGNCPNTDVLVSNKAGTRFAHVQVKTYRPGDKTVTVGAKAERDYGSGFFWVLAGIPEDGSVAAWEYYVIPSTVFAKIVSENHQLWIDTPGKMGQAHSADNKVRAVAVPPAKTPYTIHSIESYLNRWDLIITACTDNSLSPSEQAAREAILEEGDV